MEAEVLRIAHAHGNRRTRIEKAIAAGVDLIEADVRYSRGRLWVRHELKAPFVPVLFNGHVNAFHRQGPYALSLPRSFVRLNLSPIPFDELLDRVRDRVGLLLDLKAGVYTEASRERFVNMLLRMLDSRYQGTFRFCGDWRNLDALRERRPDQLVHYSVDDDSDWSRLQVRIVGGQPVRAVTIRQQMLDDHRVAFLDERNIEFYSWDIETRAQARDAVERGARGLISHHLDVFPDRTPVLRTEAS